jgi:hypothetical protein
VFYSQSIENKAAPGNPQVSAVNLRNFKLKQHEEQQRLLQSNKKLLVAEGD